MDGYVNDKLCEKCAGRCCTNIPGIFSPDDLGPNLEDKLYDGLVTGIYAIDWWEGDPRYDYTEDDNPEHLSKGYHVRPATKKSNEIYDPSWGGECKLLTPTGCALEFKERPHVCRMLKPKPDLGCTYHGEDKRELCIAWIPHHDLIKRVADKAQLARQIAVGG